MNGVVPPTAAVLHEAEEALAAAEQSGENVALAQGRQYVGLMLVRLGGSSRARGFQLLEQVRAMTLEQRYNLSVVPLIDVHVAQEKTRVGDFAGAISQSRAAVNEFFGLGSKVWSGYATNVLVDALMQSGNDADLEEAKVAVDRLAALADRARGRGARTVAAARTGAARSGMRRRSHLPRAAGRLPKDGGGAWF